MITLTKDDVKALREIFPDGPNWPQQGAYVQAMTGLNLRQLRESGVLAIGPGRWHGYTRGPQFEALCGEGMGVPA